MSESFSCYQTKPYPAHVFLMNIAKSCIVLSTFRYATLRIESLRIESLRIASLRIASVHLFARVQRQHSSFQVFSTPLKKRLHLHNLKKTHFKKLKEETHFEKNWRGEEAEEMEASDIKIKLGGGDEGISWAHMDPHLVPKVPQPLGSQATKPCATMSNDWRDWADEDDKDSDAQVAALEMVRRQEESLSYPLVNLDRLRTKTVPVEMEHSWAEINCDHVLEKKQPNNVLKKKPANKVLKKKPANNVLKKMPANKVFKKKQPETVKEFLDSPVSHPYEMRLSVFLAWKEGKSEEEGLKLEKEFLREMEKERGECCNSRMEGLKLDYDVESMDDEAVMAKIRGWESGRKVNKRRDGQWYIGLLSMSPQQPLPTGSYQRKAAKEEKQPSGTESEPRTKVSS